MSVLIFGWALRTVFVKDRMYVRVLDLFLAAFLNLCFFNTCAVTGMCALLYDDVGGAVRHDLSERGQCCPGSPESSFYPTALSVSNLECIFWYKEAINLILKYIIFFLFVLITSPRCIPNTVPIFPFWPGTPRVYRRCLALLWSQTPRRDQILTGFLTRYKSWKPKLPWCDVVSVFWMWPFLGKLLLSCYWWYLFINFKIKCTSI